MPEVPDDRDLERDRYEASALGDIEAGDVWSSGARSVPASIRAPYEYYESHVRALLKPGLRILELGSGTGRHSLMLAEGGASVTCSDIAPSALLALERRARSAGAALATVVTPMDETPFPDSSFDLVVSAGSLSYADPDRLDAEIARVLRPGGSFVCVDSLNHNPVYRVNRWVHWRIRGDRTRSTLLRMPTLPRMQRLGNRFERWSLRGFGAWSWLWSPLSPLLGESAAAAFNDACDRLPGSRRLAFKFVFEAHGLRKG